MKLADVYQNLVDRATATGEDRSADLPGGARIAVRVRYGEQIVTFSRTDKRLGEVELNTFVAHCKIPHQATRVPERVGEQGRRPEGARLRYWVAYRWSTEALEQQALALVTPPAARVATDELFPE